MTRGVAVALALAAALAACGPARRPAAAPEIRRFAFPADVFAFVNDVHWGFVDDPATGTRTWTETAPPPAFALHCSGMVRSVRQFLLHARFDPGAPRADGAAYEAIVRRVLATDPRATEPAESPVVVPGYADLWTFSRDHEAMLKGILVRDWRSVIPREDWRVPFPMQPAGQAQTAAALARDLRAGRLPIVRVLRYPEMSINHAFLVVAVDPADAALRFRAYDPNENRRLVTITWDATAETFRLPPTHYFAGGPVKLYPIYATGLL